MTPLPPLPFSTRRSEQADDDGENETEEAAQVLEELGKLPSECASFAGLDKLTFVDLPASTWEEADAPWDRACSRIGKTLLFL
jgi:hypothetical protein